MTDHTHALAVVRQAELAGLSRASVYYLPRFACEADQRLMKRIDVCVSSTRSRAHRKTKGLARVNVLTLVFLVRLAGIEPTTPWFVAKYSIQLSYSRAAADYSS